MSARARADRLLAFAAVCLAVLVLVEAVWLAFVVAPASHLDSLTDFWVYRYNGTTFLTTGQFYRPEQLAGPYANQIMVSVLYPPNALFLFVPLSLLPAPLAILAWWGGPIAVTGYVLWGLRPARWAWPVMLLLLAWPHSIGVFLFGNFDMWVMAFVAAGIRWGWPAAFVALKPSLLPFALLGIRRRSWWFVAVAIGAISLLMLPLWFDYLTVMRNLQTEDAGYSFSSIPLLMVPLVAWLGRPTHDRLSRHLGEVHVGVGA